MLVLLPIAIVTIYGLYLWVVSKKYSHFPNYLGNGLPVIGHLYHSLKNYFLTHDDILELVQRRLPPEGGLCVIWIYFVPVLAVSDPAVVEKLVDDPAFADKEPLVYENNTNLWKGTFSYAYTDKKWKERRKMTDLSMKKQNMINYHSTFVKMSKRLADKMENEKGPFDIEKYSILATLDSILETHFGCDMKMIDDDELYSFIHGWVGRVSTSFFNPVYGFFLNLIIPVTNILDKFNDIIETSKKHISIGQENDEDESKYLYFEAILRKYLLANENLKEMKQELIEMVLVGSYTVSTLTRTAVVFMATLPEIQEKAWQEQQSIFGDSDRDPTLTDLKNMDYLDRVVKEVVRFISAPSLARRTKAEINIDGKIIPSNTTVLVCSRLMRMNTNYWKNPLKFDPDRYLRNEPPTNYKHAFSIFGYGNRNCPGSQYLYSQGKVILSTLLRRFKFVSDRTFEEVKLSAQLMMDIAEGQDISVVKRK